MYKDFYNIIGEECKFVKNLYKLSDIINDLLFNNKSIDFDGNITKNNIFCNTEQLENLQLEIKDITRKSITSFIKDKDLEELFSSYGLTQKDIIIELVNYL